MWFDSWEASGRIVITSLVAYSSLIAFLRITGKRSLSKLNAFDLVVTIALGSTLSTVILSRQVPLLDGLLAFVMLLGAQYVVAYASMRSGRFQRLVKSQPVLVFYRGQFQESALRQERLNEHEVLAAVREQGFASLDEVDAVVLETAGDISVVGRTASAVSTLEGVFGPPIH